MNQALFLTICVVALTSVLSTTPEGIEWLKKNSENPDVVTLPSGLQYKVLQSGPANGLTPRANSPCTDI